MAKIECPLYQRKIEDTQCFDISMVVEKMAPERTIDKQVLSIKNYREICIKCPNHRD